MMASSPAAPPSARPPLDLDQRSYPLALSRPVQPWPLPYRRGVGGQRSSAGSMAWRSAAPSSARACSRRCAMPRRSLWSIWLAARLGGFTLLDTQFVTDHFRQFGTVEVDRDDFHRLLEAALRVKGNFLQMLKAATPAEISGSAGCAFSNRVTLGWAEPLPIFIEASTYAACHVEQRLAGGCRILASSRAAMATEDAETAHQQDAKEPPFSLSLLTFSSLPSRSAGPLLPPTLPGRA